MPGKAKSGDIGHRMGIAQDVSGPRLPLSLPAMATVALFPTLWRRVMDKRVARWMPDETGAE